MRTVIIGNGGAAVESIKALRDCGNNTEIHLFSDSAFPAVNPMLLTHYIAGEIGLEDLFPFNEDIYQKCAVDLHLGSRVRRIDAVKKTVENAAGVSLSYDNCIICSGASPVIPEKYKSKAVFTVRTVQDAIALKKRISAGMKALVVGASMIGIKVTEALVGQGIDVTMTDMQANVFPMAAHVNCAALIERKLIDNGVKLSLAKDVPDVSQYEIIVVCVGVSPNIDFVDKTQVNTERGILVDRYMRTNCEGLYAAGDCAQMRSSVSGNVAHGLWASARYMGKTAGSNISGRNEACFEVIRHNSTRFFGLDFASIGDISQGDDVFEMESHGRYCMISWKDGRIMGINLLNMPEISGILKSKTVKSRELSAVAMGLVFGRYPNIRDAFLERGA